MSNFDDLPERHQNHMTETKAESKFESLLAESKYFMRQTSDRKDYGTDYQIEAVDRGKATNIRIHVQLKGTERTANSDGSVSVIIRRVNLNYLLMQAHSFFVCYHVPTDRLLFCTVDAVTRLYEHSGKNWSQQKTLSVNFLEDLTEVQLSTMATLAKSVAISLRKSRVAQTAVHAKDLTRLLKSTLPELHVPHEVKQAAALIVSLYESGADDIISASFERFAAILPSDHDSMTHAYMAEINLGMAGRSSHLERIEEGIVFLTANIGTRPLYAGSLNYSIGNGYSALGQEAEAARAYEIALKHFASSGDASPLAECYKNLGSSYEKLGDEKKAVECFRAALRENAQLAEAHFAIGLYHQKKGEYEKALDHFDPEIFIEWPVERRSSVLAWRINALFSLDAGQAAFHDIFTVLAEAGDKGWIWPWCARLVANFGRDSVQNAELSNRFWKRYLQAHPNDSNGLREWLLNKLYLRTEKECGIGMYVQFKAEFDARIQHVRGEDAALLWDRLGHWAQDEDNWIEAERCFRIAYELKGGEYGFCLGVALNSLERFEESLPLLALQAEQIQPDDRSWFQVAFSCEKLHLVPEAVFAYAKTLALNADYDVAWFNMGGVYWNAGEREEAIRIWRTAIGRFPDHELAVILRRDLRDIFH